MTTQDESSALRTDFSSADYATGSTSQQSTLRDEVHRSLARYFEQLDGQPASDLYDLVISEVEAPLLAAVMQFTDSNQTKASTMLGLNRGTLRKKLKQYGLL